MVELTTVQGDAFQRSYKHTFLSTHLFTEDDEEWIAWEELIMHPTATESFFKLDNPRNKGNILSYPTIDAF